MSEKYTIKLFNYEGLEYEGLEYAHIHKNGEYFTDVEKEKAELICRLLNEEEKRKSLPKIDVDTDDMVSILGILENNISMILHLRPELGKTYNYDFVNRMKSKYYEKTRNLLWLE